MKDYAPISLKMHATADLIALTFLLVSPWLLGFSQFTTATRYTIALFIIGMGLNFVTDYPLGLQKNYRSNGIDSLSWLPRLYLLLRHGITLQMRGLCRGWQVLSVSTQF